MLFHLRKKKKKKIDVIFLQHTGTKGSLHHHHHRHQQRHQMLPSPTTPQQHHHPPTSPVASGLNTDSQQLPCKCSNSIVDYNSGTESTCKRIVSPAILYMPTPTPTIASLSSPLTQISTFNGRTAPEREEEEKEEKEKKEHSQENHEANRNNNTNTTPIHNGTPYKKYRSMYSYRSLDFSLDGVTVHGVISPSARSSSTTPSAQHRRSSLLSASSSSFLSSPLNSSSSRSTQSARKKSLRSASRRESSSYSPRNALKRRLSASECLSSESDDGDDEVELPPQMKKYRDGVKNGLGVTMKIKMGDSILYFPAYISDDSNVTPLRVSSFSEISKDFVPFITKDDVPNLLKDYG